MAGLLFQPALFLCLVGVHLLTPVPLILIIGLIGTGCSLVGVFNVGVVVAGFLIFHVIEF